MVCCIVGTSAMAQQLPLPDFTLKKGANNQMIIEWVNQVGKNLTELTVQRSNDSVRYFRSIYSPPNPAIAKGTYTDAKAPAGINYYRIFYTFAGGAYYFTKAQKLAYGFESADLMSKIDTAQVVKVNGDIDPTEMPGSRFRNFRDSIINETADSLFYVEKNEVLYKKSGQGNVQSVSAAAYIPMGDYVFTDVATGNLTIKLPPYQLSSYSMIIYDTDGRKPLFKIRHFSDDELILDKGSFINTGWYNYDLFQDGKLKQQGRFLVSKQISLTPSQPSFVPKKEKKSERRRVRRRRRN